MDSPSPGVSLDIRLQLLQGLPVPVIPSVKIRVSLPPFIHSFVVQERLLVIAAMAEEKLYTVTK